MACFILRNLSKIAFILAVVPCALAQRLGVDTAWLPVTDAELKMTTPIVDPNAGVEALFWRVHVVDELLGGDLERTMYQYVRLKVFSQEGKEKIATINIRYAGSTVITAVTGRTIKPDGSVLELSKDAVHEQVIAAAGGRKWKAVSFAMPGVEVGSIVEYRWKELPRDSRLLYARLPLQLEFPVRKVTYYLKPLGEHFANYTMHVWPFNCKPSPLKAESGDFQSMTLENVEAFREEPMMPGEATVRPWALLRFINESNPPPTDPHKYWPWIGKRANDKLKDSLKSTADTKALSAKATAGAASDEDKVVALIRAIRANVRNLYGRGVGEAERAEVLRKRPKDRERTAGEILKSGLGDDDELNILFAQLASEAGLEAKPAFVGSRDLAFSEDMPEVYFLPSIDMAVRIGGHWKIYDVSQHLLPARMLSWREEGQKALVTGLKNPEFVSTTVSAAADSLTSRKATLTLAADGAIEGDAEETSTGHAAEERRRDFWGESEARQQEIVKEALVRTNPQAEVTGMKVENTENPEEPMRVTYHIRIPGYAQRTGKRLLFRTAFFERGTAPLFSAAERRYNVWFPHAWKESEHVTIALPAGFVAEPAEMPGPLDFGVGTYKLAVAASGSKLDCERELQFGGEVNLLFAREQYPQIKRVFDVINRRDGHTASLRQMSGGAATQ
jgi:hypothetical protein